MQIYMMCCTRVLMQDIATKEITQKGVALSYAMAIRSYTAKRDNPDWDMINKAIIARWSVSGLERIKRRAWDLCAGKVHP